jgi:hypothetical protein
MKRNLSAAIALLFLFVFVFSMAEAMSNDVTARPCKCLGCCYRPPNHDCSALWGQYNNCTGCSCRNYFLCYPTVCNFHCPVCK